MNEPISKNNAGSLERGRSVILDDNIPERNLWASVVHKAFSDLTARKQKDRSSAEWFFLSEQSSFQWICKVLNLSSEAIIARVKEVIKKCSSAQKRNL